ncbi:glucose-6-phosphate dehydrogenase [Planosporangium thailandense]|uniref:Glucose-6-phosphate 1-dehydrogenase n=1 Tax=Planosporangium thailandense TaxID=765197 RepID=A0ABX0Y8F1_9ACTN|nr:glucose-6-phosphate dehydrogenase [Planosporangium thailandense]NJC73688.1 glucose-6-phosphate dehydrogenase [Planosporangium thailandense]
MSVRPEARSSGTGTAATLQRPERRESTVPAEDHVIVLFGATGDLAKRMLLPGLFHLARAGLLPARNRIVGASLSVLTDDEFRRHAKEAVAEFGLAEPTGEAWQEFANSLSYSPVTPTDPRPLVDAVAAAEKTLGGRPRRLYHLAVPPAAFTPTIDMLADTGLARDAHIIVEKPFGTDLTSARALNETIHAAFDESQVFRIDHFLGKESVDNILALRFANGLFEPIWNRDHISHVQIDVPETIGIEGRAAFFEPTGTFRDMIVTHLFQVLGFVAMEPPTSLAAKHLRDEKTKVFEAIPSLDPTRVVRGQYHGYRDEPGVDPQSQTETFIAARVEVDNWRWSGVPFYLRSGKSLGQKRRVVTLGFKEPSLRMFALDPDNPTVQPSNKLVIDFDDPGWIRAHFLAKEPGAAMRLGEATMTFRYADSFCVQHQLAGYERLILDAMLGDQSLFTRADGIERLWEVSTPLLEDPPPVEQYTPGSWGPDSVDRLISPHHWYLPESP